MHGYRDPPDTGDLLEGRGPAVAPVGDPVAVDGVLTIELDDFGGVARFLGRLVLGRYHRQLGARRVARHSALGVISQHQIFVQSSENSEKHIREIRVC